MERFSGVLFFDGENFVVRANERQGITQVHGPRVGPSTII